MIPKMFPYKVAPYKFTLLVVLSSLFISLWFGASTWDINFWPSDTEAYYMPAAKKLPSLQYLSDMHKSLDEVVNVRWLHGKELYILDASIFMWLLNDYSTLRPFLLVCLLSFFFSSLIIFYVTRSYWGSWVGLFCYLLFVTCFWPYQYVLFTGHQLVGLFYFLMGLFFLQDIKRNKARFLTYLISGLFMGLSFYSSSIALSYVPYYIVAFFYHEYKLIDPSKRLVSFLKNSFLNGACVLLGIALSVIYFTYPNVFYNLSAFKDYVDIVTSYQHFYYNQPALIQWIPHPELPVRGGWLWVFKYFLLIFPVLLPVYVGCVIYLVSQAIRAKGHSWVPRLKIFGLIVLSFSLPILAELKGIAQFGRNYFPFIVGLIVLLGYSLSVFLKNYSSEGKRGVSLRRILYGILGVFLINAFVNGYIFFTDIYPTRMVTTFLSKKIKDLKISTVYAYDKHLTRYNFTVCLNPDLLKHLSVRRVDLLPQIERGYFLVAPVTGLSIYRAVHTGFNNFEGDIYLNELFRKHIIKNYAVASYKTLASSRFWVHEEEVLTYLTLILNLPQWYDFDETKVWLLDIAKVKNDLKKNFPLNEMKYLFQKGVRNIGTKRPLYRYHGMRRLINRPITIPSLDFQIYKVGNPQDSLVAYVYQYDPKEKVWRPCQERFFSQPISASRITDDEEGMVVNFQFSPPLELEPGRYNVVIYRTGQQSDQNYYSIYARSSEELGME